MKYFLSCLYLFASLSTASSQTEQRLELLDIFRKVPQSSVDTLKTSFSKDSLPGWATILGSTAILYQYDEQLISYSQKKGRDLGIGNKDGTEPLLEAWGQELIRVPTDAGSAMYFIGDGWLHIGIAGSILGYGYAKNQTHEVNTGIMLVHGMLVSTIFNQTLKRSFGRESPEVKTSERGAWNLFPNFTDYNTKTASYDAMPSGHVMAATLTLTILSERYPHYKMPLYTVGGVSLGALMFQMMNNGVHWASDYPLGIAMGYVVGKVSTRMISGATEPSTASWNLLPVPKVGGMSLMALRSF